MRSWILALIFLLHGSSMAKGTDPPKAPSNAKPTTLNISNVDLIALEKHNYKLHNLETPMYTAKDGYYIEKVVEGNVEICKDLPKGAFVKVTHCYRDKWFDILHVYIVESDGKKSSQYFLKKDGQWSPIKEEDFYDHFNALSSTEHDFKEKIFSLSGNKNEWELYINESPKFQFAVYGPKSTCRVVKIVTTRYRGSTIWKRRKDEWCTMLSFYPREGDHTLLWIITKDPYEHENILYFAKGGGCFCAWNEVTREVYMDKLIDAGFNKDEFNDRVTLDISNVDGEAFFEDKYNVDIVTRNVYHVLPGFRISKVVDGMSVIWESNDDKFATYFRLNTRGENVSIGALFTTNTKKEHKIVYYAKDASGKWTPIDKSLYYDILAGRNSPIYTHDVDHPRITIFSFRNRDGLKIATYSSTVDNAKADIILIHGIRGSFLTDYGVFDMDWCYERYGFDVFPHVSIFDDPVEVKRPSNADRYRSYFEYKTLEGMNPYDISRRSRYEGCFMEALNRLGYNVYGLDLQSNGLSEGMTEKRCHVKKFKDYIYDLIQFISIIRRGTFNDHTTEVWNDGVVLKSVDCDRKLILLGYSLSGNAALQAVQEFYKTVNNPNAHFVDGLIGLSTMLNLDQYLASWWKKWLAEPFLQFDALCQPKKQAYFDYPYDVGITFERFSDYHNDMLYFNRIYTRNTAMANFSACRKVHKRAEYIPKGLPIFFVHTTGDTYCDIKGPHTFIDHLDYSKSVQFVELSGNGHHFVASQLVPIIIPRLNVWLDEMFYGGAKYLPPKPLNIMLSRVDESIFDVQEGMEKGIPVLRLKVKPGKNATKLVYMGKKVWSSSSCSSCCISSCLASSLSSATLYFNGTVLELVKVSVGDTEKLLHRTKTTCCRRTSIEWVENKTKFNARLKWLEVSKYAEVPVQKVTQPVPKSPHRDKEQPTHHVRRESLEHEPKRHVKVPQASQEETIPSPIPTIKNAILDITDVDLRVVTMSESFMDGILVRKTLTPNDGFRLMEVLDMNLPIWASSGQDGYAKSVVVHYDGAPILVTVQLAKNDGESSLTYHRSKGGQWTQVKKEECEALLNGSKETLFEEAGDVTESLIN